MVHLVCVLNASEGSSDESRFGLRRQTVYGCFLAPSPARELEFSGSGSILTCWDTTSYGSTEKLVLEPILPELPLINQLILVQADLLGQQILPLEDASVLYSRICYLSARG